MCDRLHRENFPPALSRHLSLSQSFSDATTVSEARTDTEEKSETNTAASASGKRQPPTGLAAQASKGEPAMKRARSN